MAPKPLRLSKSRFTAGLQCHRQLWWKVHEPKAPELQPDPGLRAIFDMGNRVGERARQEFPGATLIELDYRRLRQAVDATRRAIAAGDTVILEASFLEDRIFVGVDALSKEGDGWVVTEVGRQPWVIHGIMRTSEAVTPMTGLIWPFAAFTVLYVLLAVVLVFDYTNGFHDAANAIATSVSTRAS